MSDEKPVGYPMIINASIFGCLAFGLIAWGAVLKEAVESYNGTITMTREEFIKLAAKRGANAHGLWVAYKAYDALVEEGYEVVVRLNSAFIS